MTAERIARALGDAAVWYPKNLGWKVFPCHSIVDGHCSCGKQECWDSNNQGKHPITQHGLLDATSDLAAIAKWWRRWPDANIGLATGEASGVDVLDVDPRNGGDDTLRELEAKHGELPATLQSLTGGGGVHYFFRHTTGLKNTAGKIGPGLDFKTTGGFVILPPSNHISGRAYCWEGASRPEDIDAVSIPAELLKLARGSSNGNGHGRTHVAKIAQIIPDGEKHDTCVSVAGGMRRRGCNSEEIFAALLELSKRFQTPVPAGNLRDIADDIEGRYAPAAASYPLTEIGLAERLVQRYGEDLRYCHQNNRWHVWTGRNWAEDDTATVQRRAKATIRTLYESAAREKDPDRRQAVARFAIKSDGDVTIRRVLSRAAAEEGIPVRLGDFDRDSWALNCANGVIDLRSGAMTPHSRELLMRNYTAVAYHPGARSLMWERFLSDVTGGDRDLADFLQVAGGYSATGDTSEEKLFMPIGPGASGKSTLLESAKAALGGYAWVADFESFLHRPAGGGGIRSDIAELAGKRFVLSVEVDEGARLAEGLVKHLTGGDTMRARQLYQEGFLFQPQFKLWLAANHAPKARDDDSGLWRRILRIPLETVVPEARRDPTLKGRLKSAPECQQAILAWLVEGAIRWREDGLHIPACIRQATEAYREEQDPLKDFFADAVEFDAKTWVTAAELRRAYEHHCELEGIRYPLGPKQFGERLQARGCTSRVPTIEGKSTRIWEGIRVLR
jgi:putative DNA primase/helicase